MVYVKIERLNGRRDHANLGEWLNQSGLGEVDYCEGGWNDRQLGTLLPHLKFENEEDAVAFVLAHGGEISRTLPIRASDVDTGWRE